MQRTKSTDGLDSRSIHRFAGVIDVEATTPTTIDIHIDWEQLMTHHEVVKIRKALIHKWRLYNSAVIWRYLLIIMLFVGGAGLFIYAIFMIIDGNLQDGGKVLGVATSSIGSGIILTKYLQRSINIYNQCVLRIERIIINFDCDRSKQLRAAWVCADKNNALRDKYWDYMNEVLVSIQQVYAD